MVDIRRNVTSLRRFDKMPRPHGRPGLYNRFRQTEASRLMKAVAAAGLEVASVECDPATGKVVVTPKPAGAVAAETTAANPWDEVKHAAPTPRKKRTT
jgi:hypothetical protein